MNELDLSLSTVYILELYHDIVVSPHLHDSAPPTKGEGPGQAIAHDHGASNSVMHWPQKGCGFLAVRYLEAKLY